MNKTKYLLICLSRTIDKALSICTGYTTTITTTATIITTTTTTTTVTIADTDYINTKSATITT